MIGASDFVIALTLPVLVFSRGAAQLWSMGTITRVLGTLVPRALSFLVDAAWYVLVPLTLAASG